MSFHQKYRPATLDKIIGHSKAVDAMKGWIASGEYPSAILFVGPTSVGKTTLARLLCADPAVRQASSDGRGSAWAWSSAADTASRSCPSSSTTCSTPRQG